MFILDAQNLTRSGTGVHSGHVIGHTSALQRFAAVHAYRLAKRRLVVAGRAQETIARLRPRAARRDIGRGPLVDFRFTAARHISAAKNLVRVRSPAPARVVARHGFHSTTPTAVAIGTGHRPGTGCRSHIHKPTETSAQTTADHHAVRTALVHRHIHPSTVPCSAVGRAGFCARTDSDQRRHRHRPLLSDSRAAS